MITATIAVPRALKRASRAGTTRREASAAAGQSIVSRTITALVRYIAYCGIHGPASEEP